MNNDTQTHIIDTTLTFQFPVNWYVAKCDDWSFYRNQFCKVRQEPNNGMRCMDLLALAPDKTLWLIEAKDYRIHKRTKIIEPWIELRNKVSDTLAMLLPAACKAESEEKDFACKAVLAQKLRIVFVFEQPKRQSKLFPRDFDLCDIQKKLKQYVKCIDAHPLVIDTTTKPTSISWSVL